MRFRTVTGSVYEVSAGDDCYRIRRLEGSHDPTPRQGPDGEWKNAWFVSPPVTGFPVVIVWELAAEDGKTIARSTVTSDVAEILKEQPAA